MRICLPELSLVLLIGPSGAGKSTFANRHCLPTEIVSSDHCRALVCDDASNQAASHDAFDILHYIVAKRLQNRRFTVVDATNVQAESRRSLLGLARKFHILPCAIVFNLPDATYLAHNETRPDRQVPESVVRMQASQMRQSLAKLRHEGFHAVYFLESAEQCSEAVLEREPLWTDRRFEHGPFDIIGDVHGCAEELRELLVKLGYTLTPTIELDGRPGFTVQAPSGRKAVFLGDLVDRGPDTPSTLRLVMHMVATGQALCVQGNHDRKLARKLSGRDVHVTHGLAESLTQLDGEPPEFGERVQVFLDDLISNYTLDDGRLVVAHAGLKEDLQGRASARVRDFALYGETTGEADETGLPIRFNWAAEYRGAAMVAYGHTPVVEPEWINRTICLDTGCVFGGKLTALRYPEMNLVSVPARRTYCKPKRPLIAPSTPALPTHTPSNELLDLADVTGRRVITTRLVGKVIVSEQQSAQVLEAISRQTVDPRWLIYLPPTIAPVDTSHLPGLLEHPTDAFSYYRGNGLSRVVCLEQRLGSQVVVIVCQNEAACRRQFGIDGAIGCCFTQTGQRYFADADLEVQFLTQVQHALTAAGFWEQFASDWMCIEGDLLTVPATPSQPDYAAVVGSAATAALREVNLHLARASQRAQAGPDLRALAEHFQAREQASVSYVQANRAPTGVVQSLSELRFAPVHLLASEAQAHVDKPHTWHLEQLADLVPHASDLIVATTPHTVDLVESASLDAAIEWWDELSREGRGGIVVMPEAFAVRGDRGLVQPALKARGQEYLRTIYGPEYTLTVHLERLRRRAIGPKRGLASREFALGIEALERFVRGEPLRRVHECVTAILALESDPVDPRL